MIFIIPFAFAYNPLLLTVEQAGGIFTWPTYIYLLAKLLLAMYLVATALSRWELRALALHTAALRVVAAVLLLAPQVSMDYVGFALGFALLATHRFGPSGNTQTT